MSATPVLAGVDIGGTKTRALLCTEDFAIIGHDEAPTPAKEGGPAMIDTAARLVKGLLAQTGHELRAVGVGAAGVMAADGRSIRAASDSFTDWTDFPLVDRLERELGVGVTLGNDVNAFIRGEVAGGAVKERRDVLAIMLGTGVGGALWLDGRLFEGPHGGAGEIGHVPGFGDEPCSCGGRGHLETLASGRSIARRYRARSGRIAATAYDVAQLARSGDAHATDVYAEAGRAVGRAVSIVMGLLDLDTVVIGGGVAGAWDLLEPAIHADLRDDPPVGGRTAHLHRSALASDAAPLGAAAMAADVYASREASEGAERDRS